jgi:hypothetical protein
MPVCEWQLEHLESVGPNVPPTWQLSHDTFVCAPSNMKPVLKWSKVVCAQELLARSNAAAAENNSNVRFRTTARA